MIKYASIILFIGLMLFKPISQLSWEIWYQVNFDYVAEELCENNEEPELECNGQCYLMKQLEKAEVESNDEQQQAPERSKQVREENIFISSNKMIIVSCGNVDRTSVSFHYEQLNIEERSSDIFHPPRSIG